MLDTAGTLTFVEVKWTEHPDRGDAKTVLAVDEELRKSSLRLEPGHHAVVCRTPHAFPITDRVRALPHGEITALLGHG